VSVDGAPELRQPLLVLPAAEVAEIIVLRQGAGLAQ